MELSFPVLGIIFPQQVHTIKRADISRKIHTSMHLLEFAQLLRTQNTAQISGSIETFDGSTKQPETVLHTLNAHARLVIECRERRTISETSKYDIILCQVVAPGLPAASVFWFSRFSKMGIYRSNLRYIFNETRKRLR